MITAEELDDGLVLDGEVYPVTDTRPQFAICDQPTGHDGDHRPALPWTGQRRHADNAAAQARRVDRCARVLSRLEAHTRWSPHP